MLFIIKTLHNILKVLNSETAPSQLAAGIVFGAIVGLTPTMSLHNLCFFLLVCLFRVNFSMFFVSVGIFSILGWLLDPVWDQLGYWMLVDLKAARPLWVYLSSGPLLPYFRMNNTIVVGSLATSLILALPLFFASMRGVRLYRERWREKVQNSKFVKVLKATPFYGLYDKYEKAKAKFGIIS